MRYYDTHVRFEFNEYSRAGFSKVGIFGKDIFDFDDRGKLKGIKLLDSGDHSYLKPRIKRCDIIHDPDYTINSLTIQSAVRYGKPFEVSIRPLLVADRTTRARLLKRIRRFLSHCNKAGADYMFTSRATNIYEIKYPREILSMASAFGISYDQALRAITEVPGEVFGE